MLNQTLDLFGLFHNCECDVISGSAADAIIKVFINSYPSPSNARCLGIKIFVVCLSVCYPQGHLTKAKNIRNFAYNFIALGSIKEN